MFAIIKRKTIIAVIAGLMCLVAFCVAIGAASTNAYSTVKVGKTIVIDAGHGGIDGGVVGSKTGSKESDVNLAIARALKNYLVINGYDVVMTRTTTDGLYGMAAKNKKLKDMEARKKIIMDARPHMVVSIHQNSYPRGDAKGAQVFYAPTSEISKGYASIMQSQLNANLESRRVSAKGDYFILQCTEYPSILVECGFMTNAEEELKLLNGKYQDKVAYTIYSGIAAILSESGSNGVC